MTDDQIRELAADLDRLIEPGDSSDVIVRRLLERYEIRPLDQ